MRRWQMNRLPPLPKRPRARWNRLGGPRCDRQRTLRASRSGTISLGRSLQTIWHGMKEGLKDLRGGAAAREGMERTDRDLSMKLVLIGSFALVAVIALANPLYVGGTGAAARIMGALLIVILGFLFVTVSSRLTGE